MADAVEDDQYDPSSDEDFNPDVQAFVGDSPSSEEDDEAIVPLSGSVTKRGTKRARDQPEAGLELDSGDEATIRERKRRRKKQSKGANTDARDDAAQSATEDENSDAGGFVRTRAQRRTEKVERRALASTKDATVDVDALWNRLLSMPIGRAPEPETRPAEDENDYIVIKRTTKFAGQTTTEEKRVLRSSKEAKIWFDEQEAARTKKRIDKENDEPEIQQVNDEAQEEVAHAARSLPLRRPLRRPLRWDPNPNGEVKGLPPSLQLRWPRDKVVATGPAAATAASTNEAGASSHRALPKMPPTAKLNTVQKSKYDWASYVDENKLAEELDEYGRSKESFAGRTDFLNRLELKREQGRLAAKSKLVS